MFAVQQENATKLCSKNEISHIFWNHQMTSYGYIIVDFIWFELYHAVEAIL